MKENSEAMVLASFAGDALALGVHWVYDIQQIEQQFGRVEQFIRPSPESYHATKDIGELTHYGDQTLILLESVATRGGFALDHFAGRWQKLFDRYSGYFDQATRQTLAHFANGKKPAEAGSTSTELGGAARIAPLVYYYQDDPTGLINAARAQTAMTHNTPDVIDSAEFFARVAAKVLDQVSPVAAMQQVIAESFKRPPFERWVADGLESASQDTRQAIAGFGQMCEIEAAFPSVVHLIARFPDSLRDALVENVMAGGDSAARGLLAGMVLGAYLGNSAIPETWLVDLKKYDSIKQLLKQAR